MEQKIYYEDYELGSTRTTIGRTITESDIVLHAGQTGDFFPHHMDAEFAKIHTAIVITNAIFFFILSLPPNENLPF